MRNISEYIYSALKGTKKSRMLFLLSFVVLAVLSSMYIRYTWNASIKVTSQQALRSATIAEASLNGEMIKKLSAVKEDLGTLAHESIRNRLTDLVRIEQGINCAYILAKRDDKLYFIADSEPVDPMALPGDEYIEATKEDKQPFIDGNPIITKQLTDRWGTWVSVLVPMKDDKTGKIIAVFGMDYLAKTWNNNARYCVVKAGAIIFALLVLQFAIYITFNIFYMHMTLTNENQIIKQVKENVNGFLNTIHDMIFVLGTDGNIIEVNNTACRNLGYLKEELIGKTVSIVFPEKRREEVWETVVDKALRKNIDCSIPLVTKSCIEVPAETQTVMGRWNGDPALFCVVKDISELKKSEQKFSKAFNSSAALMAISTIEGGHYIDVNETFLETLGFEKSEVIGKNTFDLEIFVDKRQIEEIKKEFIKNGKVTNMEIMLKGKDGFVHNGIFWADGITLGVTPCCLTTMTDITERKKTEEENIYLSYHDQLTGLYNRRFYEEKLKRLDTKENLPLTIVMGDVNGLKLINDSLGHVMGDEVLKKAAEVIKNGCRSDDIIARLGGDEFVIILPKTDAFETEQVIKRINDLSLKEKVGSINISISLGYETKNNEEEEIRQVLKKSEDNMYKKKLFESPSIRGKTISAIISTLHEKNKREELHSHRVAQLCESMGLCLGMPEYEIMELKTVGLLHDIGKVAIEENILNKAGKLTDDEWEEVKRHSEIGYRILCTANDMSDIAEYVLAHHERWDGTGYPKGLKEKEIPLLSRIIAIADAYDAMTSERSYRTALSQEVAVEELQKNAGIQFDSELTRVFIEEVLGKIAVLK